MKCNIPPIFSNERKVASAGSGKTYNLTNRFIALSFFCDPEKICALTFTRMAAAEFLDKILSKLADAVSNDDKAAALGADIAKLTGAGVPTRSDFLDVLKKILRVLPRLTLSTIDSFQLRFASAFATELGIVGDIRIMDDFDADTAKRRVLDRVFAEASLRGDDVLKNYVRLVETASMGRSKKNAVKKIRSYTELSQRLFTDFPDVSRWGNFSLLKTRIAPVEWNSEKYSESLEELKKALYEDSGRKVKTLATFFKNSRLGKIYAGSALCSSLADSLRTGGTLEHFVFTDSKNLRNLTQKEIESVDKLLKILLGANLKSACDSAAAVGKIVADYEKIYSREVRMRGLLAFNDLSALLLDASLDTPRNLVEYRLDAKYDHWLIDEFQDTSRQQWRTLENLVSEILDAGGGNRTFYFVGDRKQSIYGWRGGAPELFDEIFAKNKGRIRDGEKLNVSRRSSKPVIAAVNALFSSLELARFNEDASAKWLKSWDKHESHPSIGDCGCAMTIEKIGHDDDDVCAQIFDIVKKIDSVNPDLDCAVLVQNNDTAKKIADGLRALAKTQMPSLVVSGELDAGIAGDNMAVSAAVALLRATCHPSDTASLRCVESTPLAEILTDENWRYNLLAKIADGGFEKFAAYISDFLKLRINADDTFTRSRLSSFCHAASEFGSRGGIDEFVKFLRTFKIRESAKQSSVKVMTIHKSKGLDFDYVILPQLENLRVNPGAMRLRTVEANDGGKTVINMPSREMCGFDNALNNEYSRVESEDALAKICKYYVATTRAKRGLYFMVNAPAKDVTDSSKYSFDRHVFNVLNSHGEACEFALSRACAAFGDPFWYEKCVAKRLQETTELTIPKIENPKRAVLPAAVLTPSRANLQTDEKASYEKTSKSVRGKIFGILVHSVFENLECFEGDFKPALEHALSKVAFPSRDLEYAVKRCIAASLENDAVRAFFTTQKNTETRKEFPFTFDDDGTFVSGTMDFVRIFKTDKGTEFVEIADFKTDADDEEDALRKRHGGQLNAYKRAAAAIFGIKQKNVRTFIISIPSGQLIEL